MARLTITDSQRAALSDAASFPLLDAIAGRRSRRFPLGGEIPDGPLAYGPGGPFHPDTPGPWADTPKVRSSALPAEAVQELVTAEASYIYDTFGKLPGTVPTVHVLMYLQAQNIDLDFYDTHFAPGAYLRTHAEH